MRLARSPIVRPVPAASAARGAGVCVRPQGRPEQAARDGSQRGQSLVEFSLVVGPLLLLLLGIIQFGFVFNAYVTMANATREAARTGTIYVYDRTVTKSVNDLARNDAIRAELLGSMNLLSSSAPQFTTGSTWTVSGTTFVNGDLTITYEIPSGMVDADNRAGQRITVRATYHQDLIIPIIANLLPHDAGGRLPLTAEVTMVAN